MDEPNAVTAAVAGLVVVFVLAILAARGVFAERAFADSPRREGTFTLIDVLAVLGLMLLGVTMMLAIVERIVPESPTEADRVVGNLVANYGGALLPVIYVLYRAATAVRGGIAGFGFGLGGNPSRTTLVTFLGLLSIIPLTLAVMALIVQFSYWIGDPAPEIAHDTLRMIQEDPTSTAAIAMIVAAVVLAPLLEETLFRGVLQTALLNTGLRDYRWGVIGIVSLLFMSVHFGALMVPQDAPQPVQPAEAAMLAQVEAPTPEPEQAEEPAPADAPDEENGGGTEAEMEAEADGEQERQFAWQGLPGLFVLSLGLGYLYERTGSLWPPIVAHALFNAMMVWVTVYTPT